MTATAKQEASQKAVAKPVGEREIHIERIFNAPRSVVWRALTEPELVAQWWGRGNKCVIERFELQRGGHWRFVEHTADGAFGFEGRFREITPPTRIEQTFEFDGMPGHVSVQAMTLDDLGDGRTRVVITVSFHTREDRDGMLQSGMETGMNESYAALDKLLATLVR
jgi:uncharacterized protein YndB with AHSA1/START domain